MTILSKHTGKSALDPAVIAKYDGKQRQFIRKQNFIVSQPNLF